MEVKANHLLDGTFTTLLPANGSNIIDLFEHVASKVFEFREEWQAYTKRRAYTNKQQDMPDEDKRRFLNMISTYLVVQACFRYFGRRPEAGEMPNNEDVLSVTSELEASLQRSAVSGIDGGLWDRTWDQVSVSAIIVAHRKYAGHKIGVFSAGHYSGFCDRKCKAPGFPRSLAEAVVKNCFPKPIRSDIDRTNTKVHAAKVAGAERRLKDFIEDRLGCIRDPNARLDDHALEFLVQMCRGTLRK